MKIIENSKIILSEYGELCDFAYQNKMEGYQQTGCPIKHSHTTCYFLIHTGNSTPSSTIASLHVNNLFRALQPAA